MFIQVHSKQEHLVDGQRFITGLAQYGLKFYRFTLRNGSLASLRVEVLPTRVRVDADTDRFLRRASHWREVSLNGPVARQVGDVLRKVL